MRVPHSLIVPDSNPPLLLIGLGASVTSARIPVGESPPEEFLREVTAALTAFLKDEPMARGLDTGEAPPAH